MLDSIRFDKQYILGNWVDSISKDRIRVISPTTMRKIVEIPAGCPQDAEKAIDATYRAFASWSKTTLEERIALFEKVLDILHQERGFLTRLEMAELGCPKLYALKKHVRYQLSRIPAYIQLAKQFVLQYKTPGATVHVEPLGPVVAITPWNYPLGQIIQKIVPALLMGNTVVLKPSSLAPLSAVVLTKAFEKAGFPPGVFNLIQGESRSFKDSLFVNPKVRMISFTGSTRVGKRIAQIASMHLTRTCLELGGKSPAIWCEGLADYQLACKRLFDSVFLNAGQTCTSLSRLLIPQSKEHELLDLMQRMIRLYPCGYPEDPRSVVGPVICLENYLKIRTMMIQARNEGAQLLVGEIPPKVPKDGYFIKPAIFVNVNPSMQIWQQEIFGPVLSVMTYESIDEAIKLANDTCYGLSSAVVGPEGLIQEVAKQLDAGNVFLNDAPRDITAPFGGFKESGIGYESGEEGLRMFVRYKSVFDKYSGYC